MTSAIEVRNLTKSYGDVVAIDDITLTIEKDAITGLLGRNGAGKTVLMSLITAQEIPTAGTVKLLGSDPNRDESVLASTLFLRDSQRYPADYRLAHLLRIAPIFHSGWDAELADKVIRAFEIPTNREIRKMSRGQLSAVAAMLGLAARAPITFFDEPYLGMDATARVVFYDLLLRDFSEHPRTIIMSTHLIDEMEPLLERVIVLDHGRVRRDTTADDLRSVGRRISGSRADIEGVLGGVVPLSASWLGAVGSVLIEDAPELIARANAAGLTVEPATLQDLVAAYGLGAQVRTAA